MKVALIPCAATEWRVAGRLLGRVELSPLPDDTARCAEWLEPLRLAGLTRLFHAPDELSARTAQFIARRLSVPAKPLDDLVEVDLGLWAGLTEDELKRRYASAHRLLRESPANVDPPQGERFSAAAERLRNCLGKCIRRNGRAAFGVVVRPLALAMARCALQRGELSTVWEAARSIEEPLIIECAGPPGVRPRG